MGGQMSGFWSFAERWMMNGDAGARTCANSQVDYYIYLEKTKIRIFALRQKTKRKKKNNKVNC